MPFIGPLKGRERRIPRSGDTQGGGERRIPRSGDTQGRSAKLMLRQR